MAVGIIKFTDNYIVDSFPDEENVVINKLNEYWNEAAQVYDKVKYLKNIADRYEKYSMEQWVFANARKYEETKRLKWLHDNIRRLERLKTLYEKKKVEKQLSKEYFKTKKEREQYDIDSMFNRESLLVDIISYSGLELKHTGSCYMCKCPFHEEKTPSFAVYKNNWFHCFGCRKHGNFIDFLMERNHLDFIEALKEANRFL